MCGSRLLLAVSLLVLFSATATLAAPPESASVAGVTNDGWSPWLDSSPSLGQLIIQSDGSFSMAGLAARTGCVTSLYRSGVFVAPRDPWRFIGRLQRDMATLSGAGYKVAFLRGGTGGDLARGADGVTVFATVDEAVTALKALIADGVPVQVSVLWDSLYDEVFAAFPSDRMAHWRYPCQVVVNGYDADFVYITHNLPHPVTAETGENMPVSWAAFVEGWSGRLTTTYRGAYPRLGPCYMSWLNGQPAGPTDQWTLACLGRKGIGVPSGLRRAAALMRSSALSDDALDNWQWLSTSGFVETVPYLTDYLTEAGRADLAAVWQTVVDEWEAADAAATWGEAADSLDAIADAMDTVLADLAATDADPAVLLSPADAENLASFDDVVLRWAALPNAGPVVLEMDGDGDWGTRADRFRLRARPGNTFCPITAARWRTVIRKDGGDRTISWRVVITGGANRGWSATPRTLTWDAGLQTP